MEFYIHTETAIQYCLPCILWLVLFSPYSYSIVTMLVKVAFVNFYDDDGGEDKLWSGCTIHT